MRVLRVILQDHLSTSISSLLGCDKVSDIIFIAEIESDFTNVAHHKKKIVFLLSAMRHFAESLRGDGFNVVYKKLDDKTNRGSWVDEIGALIDIYKIDKIVITAPSGYDFFNNVKTWSVKLGVEVQLLPDDRFLISIEDFAVWAQNKKQLRMEYFYREMRQKYLILMDSDNNPVGGKWNYDADNRKSPKANLNIPKPYCKRIDQITSEVIALVESRFDLNFGDINPFYLAVTREEALDALDMFIKERLCKFGDYQDAMIEGEPFMYHAHISFYLNCGLLLPLECIYAAEKAYFANIAPLNAVEGFIRQILGWREYIRGIYWLRMPELANDNFLEAKLPLPNFYWDAKTDLNCIKQSVLETKRNAYAHHIQRLMVLGNFALLAGILPDEVNNWFLIVYADAYQWVELPNVSGMILFADGGYLASKPYAAGGSYINKMSNYCHNCKFRVTEKTGKLACPFNYLYWDFLVRNRDKLKNNHRVAMMYRTYDRMPEEKKLEIASDSKRFLANITS